MLDINAIPHDLRARPQWLVWRYEENPKGKDKKPLKVPYYINGSKRFGTQGDSKDRSRLVPLDGAVAAMNRANGGYTGIGFAFLPGDDLIGIDIDKCIDLETGEISDLAQRAISGCNSYTEYSPSGSGFHIIVSGETETFKSNKIGLEVFAGRQYFTFTGRQYANSPAAINPIAAAELERLRSIVKSAGPIALSPAGTAAPHAKPLVPAPPGAENVRQRLEQALAFVPSDEHDIWIRVGMAVRRELGDDGFSLWNYWSSKAANYGGPDECQRRWDSFKDPKITAATVFKLAIDHGWKPPRSILPAPIKSPAPPSASASTRPSSVSPLPPGGQAAVVSSAEQALRGEGVGQAGMEIPESRVAADASQTDFDAAVESLIAAGQPPADHPAMADIPYGESASLFAGGEGAGRAKKEKPKKEYGPEHWAAVEDTLENFVLIYGEDLVWDNRQRMLMKLGSMRTIIQNSDVMKFWSGDARKWALKKNIVFDPTETPSPAESGPTATINLFSGWKMTPKQGNCSRIQTLLLHLVDGNNELYDWITRWLAYPLRNPGAKMETSIIMHGDEGSGKNFFFEKVVKTIYGEYGYVIGNAQLESNFNDWASMKLFMVADEVVTRAELKQMKGKLKYLISGDSIIVNPKGLPEHSERNQMNFVFLSNELVPLALDKTDRRYLVIWTPPALGRDFYVEVAKEIAEGGVEAFYYYLMHEVEMGDFNEHTKPIYNDAKDRLIEKSLAPAERFYREWADGLLPLPFHTVGVQQLYDSFQVWCSRSGESKYTTLTTFSPQVERYAGQTLRKHPVKYEYGNVVKQRLVFLVGEHPPEKSQREWAEDACAAFESAYQKYRRRDFGDVDGIPSTS